MIYIDNAATTFPKPLLVSSTVYDFMLKRGANPGRSGHKLSMAAAEEIYKCREAAAELFNATGPECVAFTQNATYSINLALKGALINGGHVVTSSLEHNAVMRPLYKLSKSGISYDVAKVELDDDELTVKNFEMLIKKDTVMVACMHASNVCGKVLPVKEIGALCHERGITFLVDASQTAGLLSIDMQAMNIDYLCMAGHKSLYGPMGTGLLISSKGEELETLIEGGTGSNSVSLDQPDFMPDRLESGTLNAPGIAGLRAGIEFVNKRGTEYIFKREQQLALMLYDKLSKIKEIKLYTQRPESGYVPVIGFNISSLSSVTAANLFDKEGIALRGGLHCAPSAHSCFGTLEQGMIRASFGAFNSTEDVLTLVNVTKKIAGL